MSSVKNYFKFFIKIHIIARARDFLLFCFGARANRSGWESRVLIVSLEGLGDMVVATSAMKHYKNFFVGKEICLLANRTSQLDASLFRPFIDRVVLMDYRRFAKDPLYGFQLINSLRSAGFQTVIDHDPYTTEVNGKMICVSLEAEKVFGYEGAGLVFEKPFNDSMRKNVEFVVKNIHPRYTRVVPSIDKSRVSGRGIMNVIHHYRALYEDITQKKENDYATVLSVPESARASVKVMLTAAGIEEKKYVVLDLGSSVAYKNWPVSRFAEAAGVLRNAGLAIVLIGAGGEKRLAEEFKEKYTGPCADLVGKTTIPEAVALIEKSLLLFSNDTGPVHIAIALKKPSFCILGGGQFRMISFYGYADMNKWIYRDTACFGDNWKCSQTVPQGSPSPCIAAVPVEAVKNELQNLMKHIEANMDYPKGKFQIEF